MAGSKIKKFKTSKTEISNLIKKVNSYASDVEKVKTEINNMMKGDGKSAYWEGEAARAWFTNAIKKTNKLVGNYSNTVAAVTSLAKLIEKAEMKNKNFTKAQIKYLKPDGSMFLKGLKKKKLDTMSLAIPSTVGLDVASDDKTAQSYKQYRNLYHALEGIAQDCTSLSSTWEKVANITTGDIHTRAKNRSKYITERKKEVNTIKAELEETYIGDVLFN